MCYLEFYAWSVHEQYHGIMRSILKCILCLHHHLHLSHMARRNPDSHPSLLLPVLIFTPATLVCPLSRHPPPPPPALPTLSIYTTTISPPVPLHFPPRGHSLRWWIRVTQPSLPVGGVSYWLCAVGVCNLPACAITWPADRLAEGAQRWDSVIGRLSYAKLRLANSFQVVSFYFLLFQRAVLLHLIALLISENGVNFLQKKKGGVEPLVSSTCFIYFEFK